MTGRGLIRILVALLFAVPALLVAPTTPAFAEHVVHELEGSFVGFPKTDEERDEVERVALGLDTDSSAGPSGGDVYLSEVEGFNDDSPYLSGVRKFNENGVETGVRIDGSGTPAGSFSFLLLEQSTVSLDGVAVDSSAGPNGGDVYVVDLEHRVVNRFSETGQYLCQITGRATPSPSECGGPAGSATPAGEFLPIALAVDQTGVLYVADAENAVIDKFNESGEYIGQVDDSHITKPFSIDVDSTGAIYLTNGRLLGPENAVKFDPAGSFASVIGAPGPIGVAIDRTTDDAYIAGFAGITKYDSAGSPQQTFGGLYFSLAVNSSSGRIYSGSLTSGARIYSPDTMVPLVSANQATNVGEETATLSGNVDPDGAGDAVSCRFEYWLEDGPVEIAPCLPAGLIASATDVSIDIADLSPSTIYHFRLAAANSGQSPYTKGIHRFSSEGSFTTIGPPMIVEESVSDIDRATAKLEADVDPRSFDSEVKFEYVDEEHFKAEGGFASPATKSTPMSPIGDGLSPVSVSQVLNGLTAGTTYHFRAVASNSRGTALGKGGTFTTVPVATFRSYWPYAGFKSATVEAEVNPLGMETTCNVEFVDSADFEASGYANARTAPCIEGLGSESDFVIAKAELSDLEPDSRYRLRFVASNQSGQVASKDRNLTTFGIEEFEVEVVDKNGEPFTQAGGHPYASITRIKLQHDPALVGPREENTVGILNAFLKDMITESAPGRLADTTATPKCPGHIADRGLCSGDTQIGTMTVEGFHLHAGRTFERKPFYNVVPPEGTLSRYSSRDPYTQSDARIIVGNEYGANSGSHNISQEALIIGATAEIWGVPADPTHEGRVCLDTSQSCIPTGPLRPMLRNPTSCGAPLKTRALIDTWQFPGEYVEATAETPGITGCEKVEFEPSIEVRPTTSVADSPTGLDMNIHVPQNSDPDGIAAADIRNAAFIPPRGLVINPPVAHGLVGCTPAQVGMDNDQPAKCPDASKVGTTEINSPMLDHPLRGGIYVAEPYNNPFDALFGLYLAIHDPESGVVLKLAGEVAPNPQGNQLTSNFTDNPELPFEDFRLHFFGGPRAVLRTPPTCGTFTTQATLTPWSAPASGPPAKVSDSFQITAGPGGRHCPSKEEEAPHRPSFRAGTMSPVAGRHSPFVLNLRREDGSQQIADLDIDPPEGLIARLAGTRYCPESSLNQAPGKTGKDELASPSCPAVSRVGSVTVGAGAGTAPFYVDGAAYLAGPYKGAPISLAVIVPAIAGPYDLGTVLVRTAMHVDEETGELRAESESIPKVLEGVSLDVRSVSLRFDRPEFILNPTSCDPMSVTATATSIFGQSISLVNPFQVGGCGRLGFDPKLGLRILGKTHHRAHPALQAVLRMPPGASNISRTSVTLPPTIFLDSERIREICTRPQFAARDCPQDSIYGYAKVWSPLLDEPLQGPVHMRSSSRSLPNLVAALDGQFRFAVESSVGNGRGGIKTNVEDIPDVPVSKFILTMTGGPKGLLQNAADLCKRRQRAHIEFEAQNGKVKVFRRALAMQCPPARKKRERGTR